MNQKQKEILENFIQQNKMKFKLEGDWGYAECVHTSDLKGLIEEIIKQS